MARRVTDFLKREARKDLEAAVARHSKQLGVKPRRIVLRDTVSRWGSCSSTGGLNFSWRPDSRPAVRARLSRRARGGAYRAHESFADVLDARPDGCTSETDRAEVWSKGPRRESPPLRRDVGVKVFRQGPTFIARCERRAPRDRSAESGHEIPQGARYDCIAGRERRRQIRHGAG